MKRHQTRVLLALLALFFSVSRGMSEIHLTGRGITTHDGLPSNLVHDMIQDAKGYLWLGTANGLCRYDGYSFVPISDKSDNGYANDGIGTLYYDEQNGLMWMRSATFVFHCYNLRKGCFENYIGKCDPNKTFQKFITEKNGIWMYDSYAVRHVTYDTGQFVCTDYTRKNICSNGRKIKRLVADGFGGVWILTDNGLLHIETNGVIKTVIQEGNIRMGHRWKDRCLILTNGNRVLAFDKQGKIVKETYIPAVFGEEEDVNGNIIWQDKWVIITRTKVITMDCQNYIFEKPHDMQMDYGIPLDDNNGNHWISDKDGILHLFPRKGNAMSFRLLQDTGYSIMKRRRFTVTEGTDGKSYIATFGNGLFVFHPADGHLDHYTANDRHPIITSNYLIDIMADHQGNIWVSQEEAGIVCLSQKRLPTSQHIYPEPEQSGGMANYVKGLIENKNGSITVSTRSQQRFILQPQTGILTKAGITSFDDTHIDSLTDKLGRAWIGTWEEGLQLKPKENNEAKRKVFLNQSTTESRINALAMDKTGRLWIATYHGIYTIDTKKKDVNAEDFQHYGSQEGLPSNHISCLFIDDDNQLWLGTQGYGIAKCTFKDNDEITIQQYTTKQGLVSNNIHSIISDQYGQIWAGTDDALTCIHPETMEIDVYQFGSSILDNLYSDRCALRLKDGRLLFGTHNGLTIISPDQTDKPIIKTNQAHITNLEINGISILDSGKEHPFLLLEKGLLLAHHENSLKFYFSCLDYAHPGQTIYQFWFEGIDKDWRELSTQNYADYGNLPPGHYTFHLRASEDGEETTLDITIRQPWYNTWWAWLLYLIILGTAAWYVYRNWRERFRLHQQMKLEKEVAEFRANFFTQVAHEFRTPLAIISGAVDKIEGESGTQKRPMQTAKRGVRRLTQLVNQLMEFRKINTGNLRLQVEQGEVIGFIRDIYQDFWNAAQQKDQSISFTAFEKKYTMPFDCHFIDTITYNLLSNAIKYTPQGGIITLRLKLEEGMLKMIVEDSGPGIDEGRKAQLFQPFMHGYASQGGMGIGLYTAFRMAQAHKGSLTYEQSKTLGGSLFTLTIPAEESCYKADEYRTVTAIQKTEETERHADNVILEMLPNALNDLEIAIIEDDPDMLEQIKAEVGIYFKVKGYTNGEIGFEAMKQTRPSLLICDVMLPDTNGYDIVKRLKADEELRNIPVIMLTALDDEQHQIKGYEAGADDYMVKPCNYHILVARAIQLIKWSESHQFHETPSQETDLASTTESKILTSQADKRFLERVNAIVEQHISDPNFNIDQMAEMMKMGRTKLYGKVKEMTGMSPNKLFMSERMRMAAELLEEGELNISEIGYRVGIPDASYFNKCFKQHFGVAPSKYRKEK